MVFLSKQWRQQIPLGIVLPVMLTVMLFVFTIFALILPDLKDRMMAAKREKIRDLTASAWCILADYAEKEKKGQLSRREAQMRAVARLRRLRYGTDGKDYFWINDMHPRIIMHPYRPDLEGTDVSNFADPTGKYLFVEFVKKVEAKGAGYVEYIWQWKDDPDRPLAKVSYIKSFKPWGWILGTGVYIEDVRAEVSSITRKLVTICLGIMAVIVALSLYVIWRGIQAERIRREAAQTIRESERKLATLMGNLHGMAYRCHNDPEWTMIFVSDGSHELTGYPSVDLIHNRVVAYNDLIHPGDRKKVWNRIQTALEKGQHFFLEYRIRTKSGEEKWVAEQGIGIFAETGDLIALEGFVTDITERKRAEAETVRLAQAIEHSGDSIIISDVDGTIQYVNPAFEKISGYTSAEALRKNIRFLENGEQDPAIFSQMRGAVGRGESWSGRFKFTKKDGVITEHEATVSPIMDAEGRDVGYVAVQRDITGQLKLEAMLSQAQKMEAIGTLAGGIAHDFNNILGSILGYSELLLEDVPGESPMGTSLRQIFTAGLRARDLVKQILTFSRRAEREIKPVRVNIIIEEVMRFLRASLPTTIEMVQEIESHSLVSGDSTQLHQVLMNLCTNAGYAMREKGGTLKVALVDVVLDEAFAAIYQDVEPGPYIKLVVADTGVGMPPHVVARVFDPFFTTKPKGEGTGLGLSVVHGIVKSHGGAITVYSEEGNGTTFNIFLPIIDPLLVEGTSSEEPLPKGNERILFVDDEPPLAELGEKMLVSLGYDVRSYTSSSDALVIFRGNPGAFDLVITDMTMPKMTGEQLARELMRLRPDLPVILCTGFSALIDQHKAKKMGFRAFILKPLLLHELSHIVRETLDNFSLSAD